ncbi:MAG: hypothetical protein WCD79_15865 [Chthoniobacteraceae bacterium]
MTNFKRILHVIAIMFSSLMAMISHGHADTDITKKTKKSGNGELSKSHRNDHADAKQDPPPRDREDDPPRHIDVAAMASAGHPTIFSPFPTVSFPRSVPPSSDRPSLTVSHPGQESARYPWRQKIVTTTFWIGEQPAKNNPVPNVASSWDPQWSQNYGGYDNPSTEARSNYVPVAFTPRQNPFYVALPYNDMEKGTHKAEASQVIPWFKDSYRAPDKSVCKGRWIAIRFQGRIVYAQWEDCGPFRTDHWEYVFGNDRPKPNLNHGAGLDVSPAVRDYLGMNSTDVTDWRFVDFSEVPEGPWSKLGDNNTFVLNERAKSERLAKARDDAFSRGY